MLTLVIDAIDDIIDNVTADDDVGEDETNIPAQGLPPFAITGSADTTENIFVIEIHFQKDQDQESDSDHDHDHDLDHDLNHDRDTKQDQIEGPKV